MKKYFCPNCKTESNGDDLSMNISFRRKDLNKLFGGRFCLVCYVHSIKLNIPELQEIKNDI